MNYQIIVSQTGYLPAVLTQAYLERENPDGQTEIILGGDKAIDGGFIIRSTATNHWMLVLTEVSSASIQRAICEEAIAIVDFHGCQCELGKALEALESGHPYVTKEILRLLASGSIGRPKSLSTVKLTEREESVLRLVGGGLNNSQIASQLTISVNTIRTHMQSLSQKLNVSNRTHLAIKARELGFLD